MGKDCFCFKKGICSEEKKKRWTSRAGNCSDIVYYLIKEEYPRLVGGGRKKTPALVLVPCIQGFLHLATDQQGAETSVLTMRHSLSGNVLSQLMYKCNDKGLL